MVLTARPPHGRDRPGPPARPPARPPDPVRRRVRSVVVAVVALAVAAVVAAGCGVPAGGGARVIPRNQVPFGLLSPHLPTTTPTSTPSGEPVKVFFLDSAEQYLTPRTRLVGPKATLTTVLELLLRGPYTNEIEESGTRTAITPAVQLLRSSVSAKVVTVDFNQAFGEISGTQEILAVAQVVYTVAAQFPSPAAVEVQFELNGGPVQVPNENGAEVQGPVTVGDYVALTPQSAAAATTTTTAPEPTTTAPAG
ncbi:MAG TPA: GerMN domain-containing protein [Acidimicrobiales bacterium]|nr:GerMN domain-containing protein [Acidimicrobiales bacterium]